MDVTLEKLKGEVSEWFTRKGLADTARSAHDTAVSQADVIHSQGQAAVQQAEADAATQDADADTQVAQTQASLDAAVQNETNQAAYIGGLLGLPGFPPIDDPSPDDAGTGSA